MPTFCPAALPTVNQETQTWGLWDKPPRWAGLCPLAGVRAPRRRVGVSWMSRPVGATPARGQALIMQGG